MANTQHIFDFLDSPAELSKVPVTVLFGGERYLKTMAIKQIVAGAAQGKEGDDFDMGIARLEGTAEWADVMDELCTVSLFGGGGPKLVVLDNGDDFVKRNREKLEDYVNQPRGNGTLVIVVGAWAKNTRLFKAIDKAGMQVQCDPPT